MFVHIFLNSMLCFPTSFSTVFFENFSTLLLFRASLASWGVSEIKFSILKWSLSVKAFSARSTHFFVRWKDLSVVLPSHPNYLHSFLIFLTMQFLKILSHAIDFKTEYFNSLSCLRPFWNSNTQLFSFLLLFLLMVSCHHIALLFLFASLSAQVSSCWTSSFHARVT